MSETDDIRSKTSDSHPDLPVQESQADAVPADASAAASLSSQRQAAHHTASGPSAASKAQWWLPAVGLGIPLLVLFFKLGSGGIWDPYELAEADLARRIAVNVWGAQSLVLAGADNTMPTLEVLGKGELPLTSMGLGFATFGLHEWAGRLPLALWGLAGVLTLYWAVKRLMDEKAAAYAGVILATMPLYFVQARTMLGDIVTMTALTMAVAGLAVALFDRRATGRIQGLSLALSVVGLVSGLLARGLLIGVAVPLLTVGLSWAVLRLSVRQQKPAGLLARAVGGASIGLGLLSAGVVLRYLFDPNAGQSVRLVGAWLTPAGSSATFDFMILQLGHALFPWSALVPFAVGRLFRPAEGLTPEQTEKERALRVILLLGASLAYGAFAVMAPRAGQMPFAGVAFLAAMAAIAVRDLERGAPASLTMAVGIGTLGALFYRDFKLWPEKGMSAFGISATSFPDTFKDSAGLLVGLCTGVFALLAFASWMEKDAPSKKAFDVGEYRDTARAIGRAAGGNLVFSAVVLEAALIGLAILYYLGIALRWKSIVTANAYFKLFCLNAFWAVPLAIAVILVAAFTFRDVCRVVFPRLRVSRASATIAGGALAGAILSFSYYPALASQLSPKEVFDSYTRLHASGEQLALVGINSRVASYYSGGEVQNFSDVDTAAKWLFEGDSRKWLVIRDEDLAKLNSLYRGKVRPASNLPILDARSSQILLASNKLLGSEQNQNPLNAIILPQKPNPTHPLDVDLEGQLLALGWDVVDMKGAPVQSVVAGRHYRFRFYYQVTGRVTRDWEAFIHIDGQQRRFNGDHKPMAGKYPMTLWQPGDYLVDDYEFALEPNFTPGGYMLYYGFFVGESRLKVVRGKNHENRIEGGTIHVQ